MRRDAPICPTSDAATRGVAQLFFLKNTYFFRRPMKKKTGIRSQSGRRKRNRKIDQRKQRKGPKKKQAAPPLPLWLQVLTRVD